VKTLSKLIIGLLAILLVMVEVPVYAGGFHGPSGFHGFNRPYGKVCYGRRCSKRAKRRAFMIMYSTNSSMQDQMFMMMLMMMMLNNSNSSFQYGPINTPRFSAISTPFGRSFAITRPAF